MTDRVDSSGEPPNAGGASRADALETVITCSSEFEAHALAAVLHEAGIEAFVFGTPRSAMPLNLKAFHVPVQVRAGDQDRALQTLAQHARAAQALDWNDVDVGEREDSLALTPQAQMPLVVRVGFWLAIVSVCGALILFLLLALNAA